VCKTCADFIDAAAHRSANRHSDRPAELDRFDVLSDSLRVIRIGQRFELLPDGLATAFGSVEDRCHSLGGLRLALGTRAPISFYTFGFPTDTAVGNAARGIGEMRPRKPMKSPVVKMQY